MNKTQFQHCCTVAETVLNFKQPTDVLLANYFRQNSKLGRQDRQEISATIYTLLRHFEKIQYSLNYLNSFNIHNQIICSLLLRHQRQLEPLQHLLSPQDIDLLQLFNSHDELWNNQLNTQAELPIWLIEKLQNQLNTQEIIALGKAFNATAPLDIRVNTLKTKRKKILQQLTVEEFPVSETPYSPLGIRFNTKTNLNQHPLYLNGEIEIQEEGSQLIALFTEVKRNEIVVDFCAGAGGKTLAMGAIMANKGRIYAFDTAEKRLNNLKPRLQRAGLTIVHPLLIHDEYDSKIQRLYGKCDCVLVDAPCSGLGTLRRNPDLKYRQSAQTIAEIIDLQENILQAAALLLKENGRLIYATCSILAEENQQQLQKFLLKNKGFSQRNCQTSIYSDKIDPVVDSCLQLNPHTHNTDGFFAVVLEKKNKSQGI